MLTSKSRLVHASDIYEDACQGARENIILMEFDERIFHCYVSIGVNGIP